LKKEIREYNLKALHCLSILNMENRLKLRKNLKDGIKKTKYFGHQFKFKKYSGRGIL
jgi:hypothetical protein